MSNPKFSSTLFTSTTTWTAPPGVTQIIAIGYGGGGAVVALRMISMAALVAEGAGLIRGMVFCSVAPLLTYTITVGAGGAGGAGGTSGSKSGSNGANGAATKITNGGTTLAYFFSGASGGQGGNNNYLDGYSSFGGACFIRGFGNNAFVNFNNSLTASTGSSSPACGGSGGISTGATGQQGYQGALNLVGGFAAGSAGGKWWPGWGQRRGWRRSRCWWCLRERGQWCFFWLF